MNENTPKCCRLGCEREAQHEIRWDNTPDGYTHACTHDVGYLLPDQVATVYPVPAPDGK